MVAEWGPRPVLGEAGNRKELSSGSHSHTPCPSSVVRAGTAGETWGRSVWKNFQVKGNLPWVTVSQKGHSIRLSVLLYLWYLSPNPVLLEDSYIPFKTLLSIASVKSSLIPF